MYETERKKTFVENSERLPVNTLLTQMRLQWVDIKIRDEMFDLCIGGCVIFKFLIKIGVFYLKPEKNSFLI